MANKIRKEEHLHSLQLWWTVIVVAMLGITYFMDDHRAEKEARLARRANPLFERLPANDESYPSQSE